MKVFVGPRSDPHGGDLVAEVARTLAGPRGSVVSLRELGVTTLRRPLTAAELAGLRAGLVGSGAVVGYVCQGLWSEVGAEPMRATVAGSRPGPRNQEPGEVGAGRPACLVVVADHADLAWRSPLRGPNDEAVGPRFPSLAGAYAPEAAADRLQGAEGMIVRRRVVAGVHDDQALLPFEVRMMTEMGFEAASCELVTPVIVAAHMKLRVAAVVVAWRPSPSS
jgi:hypothetical protein